MSISSDLPTTISKPLKTRTKLPIYLITAIVIGLVIIVLLVNFFHRSYLDDNDDDEAGKTSTSISPSSRRPIIDPLKFETIQSIIRSTTSAATSTLQKSSESSEESNESSSQESTSSSLNNQILTMTSSAPLKTDDDSTPTGSISTSSSAPSSSPQPPTTRFETTKSSTIVSTRRPIECDKTCRINVVETIPRGVHFSGQILTKNSFESWQQLIADSTSEIQIFAYKMNLRGLELPYDYDNSTYEGRQLFELLENQSKSGVVIKLIDNQSANSSSTRFVDADALEKSGSIRRNGLDMNLWNGGGGGVHHMKTFIIDQRHLFIGSMNFDWRSLSQKLEIGVEFVDCPCIASDASFLFNQIFNSLSGEAKFEPVEFQRYQIGNATIQFLASPSFFLSSAESWDFAKLLNLIYEADVFLDIAVMQYFPSWIYFKKQEFFSQFDNAIRMSISRGVQIRILVSGDNKEEQKLMFDYLHSLQVLNSPSNQRRIQVKYILIPQPFLDFSKRNREFHAKFTLSEKQTFIGTSNYAPEYFFKSSGSAVIIEELPSNGIINQQVKEVFERYWRSEYSISLHEFGELRQFLPSTFQPSNPFTNFFGFDRIGLFKPASAYSANKLLNDDSESNFSDFLPPVVLI